MNSPIVIGLCGAEGAGKTSISRMIAARLPETVIHPFASPLKRMLEVLGVPASSLYGTPEDKERALDILGGKSARFAAQRLGTEWGRDLISPDLWVNAWKRQVEMMPPGAVVVADDLRFHNESLTVKELGGVVVCVRRAEVELSASDRHSCHPSQRWWDLAIDVQIRNDGTIMGLAAALDNAMPLMSQLVSKRQVAA